MKRDKSKDSGESNQAACVPCEAFLGGDKPEACTLFQDYLTPEEEEVLAMLRSLKRDARSLSGKIQELAKSIDMALVEKPEASLSPEERDRRKAQESLYEEWQDLSKQLEKLRVLWKEWTERRDKAQHRKMVLLGHLPPGEPT
jgi:hypothetical protein